MRTYLHLPTRRSITADIVAICHTHRGVRIVLQADVIRACLAHGATQIWHPWLAFAAERHLVDATEHALGAEIHREVRRIHDVIGMNCGCWRGLSIVPVVAKHPRRLVEDGSSQHEGILRKQMHRSMGCTSPAMACPLRHLAGRSSLASKGWSMSDSS